MTRQARSPSATRRTATAGLLFWLAWLCMGCSAQGAFAAVEEEVSIDGGPARLWGTLLRPPGDARVPAVLILSGSGPTDRDGNGPGLHNDSLKLLAENLAVAGIASLRIDKRGVGASAGAMVGEAALRFETYVEDAVRWFDALAARDWVRGVAIVGHSEGALVGTLAAQERTPAGLVAIAGAGLPAGRLLRRQLASAGLPAAVLREAEAVIDALENGRQVARVHEALGPLFRPSVQPYLISWFRRDPAEALSKVGAPVLVIQGTRDLQVSLEDARRLVAGRPSDGRSGAELEVVDGMNHVLKQVPDRAEANLMAYNDPSLPLAAGLLERLLPFLGGLAFDR